MSYNHFEQEYILESSFQLEAAVKNNFPFDPSNDSDFSFKGNELNNEEENLHYKSTNTYSSKSVNPQIIEIINEVTESIECVEIKKEKEIENKSENSKELQKKRKNSSVGKNKKNKKLNNWRKKVARNFFNKYLKNIIKKMGTSCKVVICIENFPDKFIFNVIKTNNKFILEMTFEELIKKEELYKGKEAKNYYFKNKESLEKIKSNMHLVNTEELDIDKILKMKFKDLYKDYLHSDEYKLKKSKLFEEKGISEGKMFEEMSENFIEYYKL